MLTAMPGRSLLLCPRLRASIAHMKAGDDLEMSSNKDDLITIRLNLRHQSSLDRIEYGRDWNFACIIRHWGERERALSIYYYITPPKFHYIGLMVDLLILIWVLRSTGLQPGCGLAG